MNSQFTARPPLPVWQGSGGGFRKHVRRMFLSVMRIFWQAIIPFNRRPEEPQTLPDSADELDETQVAQCQSIFDQAESRRTHLEQKAQWTFALIVFLVPLLAAIFVFLLRDTTANTVSRTLAIAFLSVSAGLLLLGFISAVRAVSVQAREMLFLTAIVDPKDGQFRKYSRSFHARGLLYCAAMNTAMNDHIAQFVKGAHILTAAAVIVLLAAAIPAGIAFTDHRSPAIRAEIVGPVSLSSPDLTALRDDIASLRKDIAVLASSKTEEDWLKLLEARVTKLETNLSDLQKAMPASPGKN